MRDVLLLTKVLFQNSLGKNVTEKASNGSKITTTILILVVSAYVIGVLGYFGYEIINTLMTIRQEELFISFSLLLICGFTLFRTIFTAINILYFSKDVEFLLPMPIAPIKIVFAKFNLMLISNYITELVVLGIPYVIYWYLLKLKAIFLLYALLIFLVIPIIPMLISSVIIVFIMRFTSFLKNKDVVQYISVLITIAIVLGMQMITASSNSTTTFVLANKVAEINGFSSVVMKYFFEIKQAVNVLLANDNLEALKNLGLLYLENVGAYVLAIFLISKMYLKSAVKVSSSGIKTRKLNIKESNKKMIGFTYIAKEFKQLFRTPIYLLQCVLPGFLFPILFSIPLYQEFQNVGTSDASLIELKEFGIQIISSGFGFGALIVVINFLYMFNVMSVTAISREGQNALFMKYIPIPLARQYKYKAIPGIIINLVPMFFVLAVLKFLIPELNFILGLELTWIAILSNVIVNYFSVMIDVLKPKLHWTSEYAVVKQNMNMLYGFFINLVVVGIVIGSASYIDDIHILTCILSVVMISVLVIFEVFLRKFERQIFRKIS